MDDVRRGIDALDLDPHDARAPLVGRVVEDLAQLGVDRVARRERVVELDIADHVAQVGLREFGDGELEVGDVVREPLRVGGLVVDDGVDRDDDIVGGDDLLRRDVDDLLAHVDEQNPVDEREDQPQSGVDGGVVLPEPFDEPALVRPHDANALGNDDEQDEGEDDEDSDCGFHTATPRVVSR